MICSPAVKIGPWVAMSPIVSVQLLFRAVPLMWRPESSAAIGDIEPVPAPIEVPFLDEQEEELPPPPCAECQGIYGHVWCCSKGVESAATFQSNPKRIALMSSLLGEAGYDPEESCIRCAEECEAANAAYPGRDFDLIARHWRLVASRIPAAKLTWLRKKK